MGGREGLEKKVKQADAVSSLLEKYGLEGLKKSVGKPRLWVLYSRVMVWKA
jgi:hypothetical protein